MIRTTLCLLSLLAGPLMCQDFRAVGNQLQLNTGQQTAGLMAIARPPFSTHSFSGVEIHFAFTDLITVLPFTSDNKGKWLLPYPANVKLNVVVQCFWLEQGKLVASQALQLRQNTYQEWSQGPSFNQQTWPIGVWLQHPRKAAEYKAIGINTYMGLWQGPTETQLSSLAAQAMPVMALQNTVGLTSINRGLIKGWTHVDEPDNAQWNKVTQKYDPPITPAVIQQRYLDMKKKDPTRPVFLGLGQGVAYEKWIGRGTRTGHLEDYPEYIKGTDIVCFDIYPIAAPAKPEVNGRLEYVGKGVTRLVNWAKEKPVWNWIEAAGISNGIRPTPAQIRSEVWMSIIAGATGTMYFVHEFHPKFIEYTVLVDPVLKAGVKGINSRLKSLAGVLTSSSIRGAVNVNHGTIHILVKQYGNKFYIFANNMTQVTTKADFTIAGMGTKMATVLDENRTLPIQAGQFTDTFTKYQVHLYEIN